MQPPTPPSFIVRPRGTLRCSLLTTITTLIPFGLCFILLATAVMMFEVVLEETLDPRHSGDVEKASYKKSCIV